MLRTQRAATRATVLAGVVAVCLASASPVAAFGARSEAGRATSATVTLTVQMSSTIASPGDVQFQDSNGVVLGSCLGSKKVGTTTCVVKAKKAKTIVLVAQPASSGSFKSWADACAPVTGAVCALYVTANTNVIGYFAKGTTAPAAVPTLASVDGDVKGCSGYEDSETVNGTGFASLVAVTLRENGKLVASGDTTSTGTAQLKYTAQSTFGIYRSLVMATATQSAKADVYNVGSICWTPAGVNTGTVKFSLVGSDFDAHSKVTVRFGTNKPATAMTSGSGAFALTTPGYACKAGTKSTLEESAIRGLHTKFSRTFDLKQTISC